MECLLFFLRLNRLSNFEIIESVARTNMKILAFLSQLKSFQRQSGKKNMKVASKLTSHNCGVIDIAFSGPPAALGRETGIIELGGSSWTVRIATESNCFEECILTNKSAASVVATFQVCILNNARKEIAGILEIQGQSKRRFAVEKEESLTFSKPFGRSFAKIKTNEL